MEASIQTKEVIKAKSKARGSTKNLRPLARRKEEA